MTDTNGKQFNKVYIIGEIDEENTTDWLKAIDVAELEVLNKSNELNLEIPLTIEILSYGGNTHFSLALADRITRLRVPSVTIVNGACASGGTLISMSGDWRQMSQNSFMLIHQQSTMDLWGTHEYLKDFIESDAKLNDTLINFYAARSNLSRKKVRKLLKRDKWLTAEECLNYGFIDEII